MRSFLVLLFVSLVAAHSIRAGDEKANALADAVIAASGGANFSKVKSLEFTFNFEANGKTTLSAKHHWDLEKHTDTVTWGSKTVTVDLWEKNDQGDAKEAYMRWVNDSYWLIAPLKLRDRGTQLSHLGEQQVDGKPTPVLQITFEQVGLTPVDQYKLYIDPETNLLRQWDYLPGGVKKFSSTWEKYQDFGGLKLATEHRFDDKRIYFSDVKAKTE